MAELWCAISTGPRHSRHGPPARSHQPIGSAECPVGLPPVEPQYFRSRPPPPGPGGLGPHRGLEPAHCPSGWSCLAWALVESLGDSSRATLSALWHLGDRCRGLGARASAQGCLCPPQGPGPPGRRQKARGTAPGRLGRAIFSVAAPAPFVTQTVQGPTRTRCLDPGGPDLGAPGTPTPLVRQGGWVWGHVCPVLCRSLHRAGFLT